VTAILSSTLFASAQRSDLKHKQFDLALQEKHVHILEGYIKFFRTETHKKKLFAQAAIRYISGAKKKKKYIYIHSRHTDFKIFTHGTKTI
jgi:hypothetical protein